MLLPTLQKALELADRADFCVGYFNLRGWKSLDEYVEKWPGGEGHCCRLLVGMQRLPEEDLRSTLYAATECYRWSAVERPQLFARLVYEQVEYKYLSLPKISCALEHSILHKIWADGVSLDEQQTGGQHVTYYSRKIHNFLQALDFIPEVYDGTGSLRPPTELKELAFAKPVEAALAFCLLNSSLFRWFINVFSDCRHVNKREVEGFRIDLSRATKGIESTWLKLAKQLSKRLRDTSEFRSMRFAHDHLRVPCIIPKFAKDIIDEVDRELGRHFGLTFDEVDFVINYDIKYRMGSDNTTDEDSD